ncbi:MAG: fibronectin type III domain-containing protein [bacterium]|nr:fibronectin type III domain-containing protein [bacterium]
MKVSKKAAVFMILLISLSVLFFACTKKSQLTALASGPLITALTYSASSTGATITWTTSTAATSKVYYGTSTSFSSSTTETDTGASVTKNHSVSITGLTASTKYYYYVASKDAANNTSTLGEDGSYSFTTTAAGPTISGVSATPTTSSCSVKWTTSVGATSQVYYGKTTSFESHTTETTTATTTSHNVSLINLTADTTYYYYVRSKDANNNVTTYGDSGSLTFYTSGSSSSTTVMYLLIDDIKIEGTGGTTRQIYLNTLDPSANIITGDNAGNNVAYMCASPQPGDAAGWALVFPADPNFAYTADPSPATGSTQCWRNAFDYSTKTWAGMLILSSGYFRDQWATTTPTPTAGSLAGPTGTVKLKCYMKVTGVASAKIKYGIGESTGESIVSQKTAVVTVDNTWQQFDDVDLTGLDLSSINGIFLWVAGTGVGTITP